MSKAVLIKTGVVTVALSLLAIASAAYLIDQWWARPLTLTETDKEYVVESGSSLSRVAYDLNKKGILTHPRLFLAMAKLHGDAPIHAGEYKIFAADTPQTLLSKLVQGDVITYQVTLVEGWTFKETLTRLHAQPKILQTLTDDVSIEFFFETLAIDLEGYSAKAELTVQQNLEGLFFPDTYRYSYGAKDIDILKQAYSRMRDILATEWKVRGENLPFKNMYEALVMASIVEKETGAPSEREQIAGVFVRRLQKNMRLATDPTVIFGLGDIYQGNIRRRHLREATPYNTYVIFGLPPTPIAMPGREAIRAALHPDNDSTLYFVAKGDGSHYFSSTLEEHNKAVQQYQVQNRSQNYRSAPATNN